jgi:hypothetical protein
MSRHASQFSFHVVRSSVKSSDDQVEKVSGHGDAADRSLRRYTAFSSIAPTRFFRALRTRSMPTTLKRTIVGGAAAMPLLTALVHLTALLQLFRRLIAGLIVASLSLTALTARVSAADEPGRGWLGMAVDDSLVPGRLVVVEVDAAGPARDAGVKLQDMVLAVNGEPTIDAERFAAAVAAIAPGDEVLLAVGRGGKVDEIRLKAGTATPASVAPQVEPKPVVPDATVPQAPPVPRELDARSEPGGFTLDTPVPPAVPPAAEPAASPADHARPLSRFGPTTTKNEPTEPDRQQPASTTDNPSAGPIKTALGVRSVPVDPQVQAIYKLPEPTGALVVGVIDDMPASRAGLPSGSVIVALDKRPVRSPVELTRLVSESPVGRPVRLDLILPGGEPRAADVSLVALETDATTTGAGPSNRTPMPASVPLDDEIRRLRAEIERLARQLDEFERRAAGGL